MGVVACAVAVVGEEHCCLAGKEVELLMGEVGGCVVEELWVEEVVGVEEVGVLAGGGIEPVIACCCGSGCGAGEDLDIEVGGLVGCLELECEVVGGGVGVVVDEDELEWAIGLVGYCLERFGEERWAVVEGDYEGEGGRSGE